MTTRRAACAAENCRSCVRVSRYGFQCATAPSVSVGPDLSSAVKPGSPNSKRLSPATQPSSLADRTLAV